MNIFQRLFKKDFTEYQLNNEDWELLSRMLYKFVNRDQNINPIVNKTDFITKGYAYNGTVYSIINLRSTIAKGIPWLVYKIKNTQKFRQYNGLTRKDIDLHRTLVLKEQALEEVENTPLNKLLEAPNPEMSWAEIIESLFIYRDVTGDSYLYNIENPTLKTIMQMWALPADQVRIVGGPYLQPVKGYRLDGIFQDMLPPEKVMHWKYFNPLWSADGKQLYGMSPLLAAARTINSDNAGIDNENSSFANEGVKAIITGTENTDIDFTKEQADILLKKFQKAVTRAKAGQGNLAFNRAPLNVLKIGETPIDLGVLDSRKYNKEVLANIFRIHPSMLSSDAATMNNTKEGRKSILTMSVLPDMDGLRERLNSVFRKSFGLEYFVDYDIMAISELQDDLKVLSETLRNMDWVTRNEKRAATWYDEYPDKAADMLYSTMNEIPLGMDFDTSFDNVDENLKKLR